MGDFIFGYFMDSIFKSLVVGVFAIDAHGAGVEREPDAMILDLRACDGCCAGSGIHASIVLFDEGIVEEQISLVVERCFGLE